MKFWYKFGTFQLNENLKIKVSHYQPFLLFSRDYTKRNNFLFGLILHTSML